MKFWELYTISANDAPKMRAPALREVLSEVKWQEYFDWYIKFDRYVETQNRKILDHEMPDELCREVLKKVKLRFQVTPEDRIWSIEKETMIYPEDKVYTALEAFELFTGLTLVDAMEYGGHKVEYR